MKLFNKKSNEVVENVNLTNETEQIEILSFDDKPLENTLETKKENRVILIIVGVIILLVLLFPTISNVFRKKPGITYGEKEEEEVINNKTLDGFLTIGNEEGSITVKNIQFYNFKKKSSNVINFVYLPNTSIKNVNEKNIYIELYNSNKVAIYRTKFVSDKDLGRKVQSIYNMTLNENLYGESAYAKVTVLKKEDFSKLSESLTCTLSSLVEENELKIKIVYNFSEKGLVNYEVSKEIVNEIDEDVNNYFEEEASSLSKYNIENLVNENNKLSYSINLLDEKFENYKSDYKLGSTYRQIKLESEKNKWSCE